MATTIPQSASTTMSTTGLRHFRSVRRPSVAWSTESLRHDAVDARRQQDLNGVLDHDDPPGPEVGR